jgi:hypothetical protein
LRAKSKPDWMESSFLLRKKSHLRNVILSNIQRHNRLIQIQFYLSV